jgi:hypothetical protein
VQYQIAIKWEKRRAADCASKKETKHLKENVLELIKVVEQQERRIQMLEGAARGIGIS